GPQRVDGASDAHAEPALQRDAALFAPSQAHVAFAGVVHHRQAPQQRGVAGQRGARADLDVVHVPFGAVLVDVAAAGAAGLAVEAHADSFARSCRSRRGISTTSASGRSSTRRASMAAQRRAPAPTRKSACAATSGRPNSDQASGKSFTIAPPAAEPNPAARPPTAATAPT